jgi:ribosome-binding protein aMBF1 (putative translation factor)
MSKTKIGRPYTSRTIQKILKKYITEDQKKMEKRMALAIRLRAAMEALNMSPKDLAQRLTKRPAEIKRLLNGTQEFHGDLLIKMEGILGTKLTDS